MHMQFSSRSRCFNFGMSLHLCPNLVYASSEALAAHTKISYSGPFICMVPLAFVMIILAGIQQAVQVGMCTHRRLRSDCALAVRSESLMGPLCTAKSPTFLQAEN